MTALYITKSIKSTLYVRDKNRFIYIWKSTLYLPCIFCTLVASSQLLLNSQSHSESIHNKTEIFWHRAEQWRTEQEIYGKFRSNFRKFLRRPSKLNNFIVWFGFRIRFFTNIELAGSKNEGKNDLVTRECHLFLWYLESSFSKWISIRNFIMNVPQTLIWFKIASVILAMQR